MIRKKGYDIKQFTITSDNIGEFKVMENRRQISDIHVSKIHGAILAGKNPVGILIVNLRNKEMRLIDGNHRIEAVKRFYGYKRAYAKIKIECILKIHTNLTDEEEKQVYADEAKRRNESFEDRLNMYKDVIIFWKLFQDRLNPFPCKVSIYPSTGSIKFRLILNSIYTSINQTDKGYYPKYLHKDDLINFAQSLGIMEFNLFKEFIVFFQDAFGKVNSDNVFTRSNFFIPLFDIYVRNRGYKKDSNFKARFMRILGRTDLLTYITITSRESQCKIRSLMLEYMNWKIVHRQFV